MPTSDAITSLDPQKKNELIQTLLVVHERDQKLLVEEHEQRVFTEGELKSAIQSSESWKSLYNSEIEAHNKTRISLTEKEAAKLELKVAFDKLTDQVKSDQTYIDSLERKNKYLKFKGIVFSFGSFGAGFGTGYIVRGNK